MKTSFNYTKEDFKKYLIKSRLINNIVLYIVGFLLYIFFSYKNISLIYLPIFMIALLILIYLLNVFYVFSYIKVNDMLNNNIYGKYVLELTPNKFSVKVNNFKTDYKYKNIKYIKEKKNLFIIKFNKSRECLTFEKRFFELDEYVNIIKNFNEKSK